MEDQVINLPKGNSNQVITWVNGNGLNFDEDDCDCKHEWKTYIGLTEAFQYCTKCEEKRDIDGIT